MSALRPFEAAARHENFSKAADELFVTQAAISKRIRMLEDHLGTALFIRNGRNLELTAAGRELHHAVAKGLQQIINGSDRLRRESRSNRVTIAMRLSFANCFMAPRLAQLKASFPEVEFNFQATEGNPSNMLDIADMAVVLGHEPQPYIAADLLIEEEIVPVCSPAYIKANPHLQTAQDLVHAELLHLDASHWNTLPWAQADWSVVFNHFNIAANDDLRGLSFNNFEMLSTAASAGLGVAIGWQHLVEHMLNDGRLVCPLVETYKIGRQHFLLSREAQAHVPLFQDLRAWFLQQTDKFRNND